jgi:hypothetical protein
MLQKLLIGKGREIHTLLGLLEIFNNHWCSFQYAVFT